MRIFKRVLSIAVAVVMLGCITVSAFAQSDSLTSKHSFVPGEIYIEDVPMKSFSSVAAENSVSAKNRRLGAAELPEKYSSVEEGYVTAVKDQGNYGTCWAHATAAATESSVIKNLGFSTDINMSELHLAYFHYNNSYDALSMLKGDGQSIGSAYRRDGFLDMGGSPYLTPFTLARWTSAVDENENSDYAYSNATKSFKVENKAEAFSLTDVHLEDMYWVSPADIDDMKKMIMEYGAGTFSYYHNDVYFNEATSAYCNMSSTSTNHQVTVVGWDDNYSRTNFNSFSQPKNNGAWLIKNSWDTVWGDQGYFWVSYEDTSALSSYSQFYNYGLKDNFDKNYQYDGTCLFDYEEIDGCATMANVFTAESEEELKAFSFWTVQNDVDYSAQLYTNLEDLSDPASGTPVLETPITGNESYNGYHTIRLDESVALSEGTTFSVVITLFTNSEEKTDLVIDKTDKSWQWVIFTNDTKPGESFFKLADSTWEDKSASGINYRIKAFTDVVGGMEDTDYYIDDPDEEYEDSDDYDDFWWYYMNWDTVDNTVDNPNAKGPHNAVIGSVKLGDADGDSNVNMSDVVYMQRVIAQITTISSTNLKAADIDSDGDVTMKDVVLLQKHIAGLI